MCDQDDSGPLRLGFSEPSADVFAKLADLMRVPIWIFNKDLIVVYANQQCRLVNDECEIGRSLSDFPPGFHNVLQPLIRDCRLSGETLGFEGWVMLTEQRRCNWKITCQALPDEHIGVIVNDWTGRKTAEADLVKSNERFRQLFESMSEGVCAVDAAGNFEMANTALERMLAVEAGGLIGRSYYEFITPGQTDPAEYQQQQRDNNEQMTFEYNVISGGEPRVLRITAQPRFAANGEHIGSFALLQDFTQVRQQEQQLRASEARYRAFLNALPDMIFLVSRDGTFLDYHARDISKLAAGPDGIIGRKVHELLPEGLARLTMERVEEALATGQMQTYEYELKVSTGLKQFESRATVSGDNEILAVIRDITDRKQTEQQLLESEARFTVLVESMPQGVAILDNDFVITYVNDHLCQMVGYQRAELIGRSALDLVDQPSELMWVEGIARHQEDNEPCQVEITLLAKDGRQMVTLASPALIYDEQGEVTSSFAIFTDITQQKQIEQALHYSYDEYRTVVDSSVDAIITIDDQGLIRQFNPAAQAMFGYRPGAMIGQPPERLMAASLRENHGQFVSSFFATGKPDAAINKTLELPALHADGTEFPIELSLSAGTARHGRFVLAVVRDISQRQQMVKALHESELRYRYIFENAAEGIMFIDAQPGGDLVCGLVNSAAERLLGAGPGELTGRSIKDFFNEADLPKINAEIRNRAAGEASKYQARLLRLDGEMRDVVISASPRFAEDGTFQGSFTLIWDAGNFPERQGD